MGLSQDADSCSTWPCPEGWLWGNGLVGETQQTCDSILNTPTVFPLLSLCSFKRLGSCLPHFASLTLTHSASTSSSSGSQVLCTVLFPVWSDLRLSGKYVDFSSLAPCRVAGTQGGADNNHVTPSTYCVRHPANSLGAGRKVLLPLPVMLRLKQVKSGAH